MFEHDRQTNFEPSEQKVDSHSDEGTLRDEIFHYRLKITWDNFFNIYHCAKFNYEYGKIYKE